MLIGRWVSKPKGRPPHFPVGVLGRGYFHDHGTRLHPHAHMATLARCLTPVPLPPHAVLPFCGRRLTDADSQLHHAGLHALLRRAVSRLMPGTLMHAMSDT